MKNTLGSLQSGVLGSNRETWGGSVMAWATPSWYSILLAPLLPFRAELCNQVHLMIQTLFPNNDAGSQDDNTPTHTAGPLQSWF
jgi:hypothetical protein